MVLCEGSLRSKVLVELCSKFFHFLKEFSCIILKNVVYFNSWKKALFKTNNGSVAQSGESVNGAVASARYTGRRLVRDTRSQTKCRRRSGVRFPSLPAFIVDRQSLSIEQRGVN